MRLTFVCPECERTQPVAIEVGGDVVCPGCGWRRAAMPEQWLGGQLQQCLVCGCGELFLRKNFSQRLGVAIVAAAAVSSLIAWGFHLRFTAYGILFGAALLDLVVYCCVGNLLQCYRCHAEYRGLSGLDQHAAFSLETHERYRQQRIRLQASAASPSKEA